jgi:formate hydrogenlyase subunit 6/NADH:ubiquinone oxidoreductase subunit I
MIKPGKFVKEAICSLFKKPATCRYPYEKACVPDKIRGKIVFTPSKCVGCQLCVKDCPSAAIRINKIADKQFEAVFDFDKCIFCAQCVDSCNKKALEFTSDFELAQLKRSNLRVTYK